MNCLFLPLAHAQSIGGPGISVKPTIQEINVKSGENKQISISVNNLYDSNITGDIYYYDFDPTIDGVPKIKGDSEYNLNYGLTKYISGPSSFSVAGSLEKPFNFNVNIPGNLAAKSYYGLVTFSYKEPSDTKDKETAVASVVLVNVGQPTYKASIKEINIEKSDFSAENNTAMINVIINNDGVYYFKPEVTLEILNSDQQVVKEINPEGLGNILPESSRIFKANWEGSVDKNKSYFVRAKVKLPNGESISSAPSDFYKPITKDSVDINNEPTVAKDEGKSNLLLISIIALASLVVIATLSFVFINRKRHDANKDNKQLNKLNADENDIATKDADNSKEDGTTDINKD